jgi:hypothetical protein
MIDAGIRPRSLTFSPRSRAHCRISELRSRPGPVRALRRREPPPLTRLAWFLSMRGTDIDLEGGAVYRERNRLVPFDLAIVREITNYRYHGLLHHQAAFH